MTRAAAAKGCAHDLTVLCADARGPHYDRPIRAEQITILNFSDSRQTEIHRVGCAHEAKASRIDPVPEGEEPGLWDDWFHVAPCAARR